MKRIILIFLFYLSYLAGYSQTDTTFWFAAPDISSAFNYDKPIILRISSYQQPCTITISQPASGGFPAQSISLPANTTQSVDLTSWLNNIECLGNIIQNNGLKIHSDNNIAVYYEVSSTGPNPEIFALKGRNALGNQFYISSQYFLDNTPTYNPLPYSSFNIVATEDNTIVTITPAKDIVGHAANVPFNITLNKGQTYAAIATSQAAAQHLQGSYVTSTKPIAITLSDDLLYGTQYGGICADLAGDQTVPVDVVGNDYIAFQSNLRAPYDKVYITATQNATTVTQDGINITTLNAGESTELTVSNNVSYIQTSAPAYAYELSGYGCEAGEALLPKINCTGSSSVSLTRSTNETFVITLLVRSGGQNTFLVNNVSGVITAGQFSAVPGTGGVWYYAKINLPLSDYPNGTIIKVSNTSEIFQCGVLQGDISGVGFGYFSDFNSLRAHASANLLEPCEGSTLQLSADTIASATYNWTGPNGFTSNIKDPIINNITLINSGKYILTVTVLNCFVEDDSIIITVKPKSFSTINTQICQGQTYLGYTANGTYIDTLVSANGCDSIRTLNLTVKLIPTSTVNQTICEGQVYFGHTTTGTYTDTLVAVNGCDSILITNLIVKPKTVVTINQTICEGQTFLGYDSSGTYADTLIAANGCDSIRILNLIVSLASFITVNQIICNGQSFLGHDTTGTYIDTLIAVNGCDSIRTLNLTVRAITMSTINQTICNGETYLGHTITGIFIDTLIAANGCDSILTLNLMVIPVSASTISQTICNGQNYFGHTTSGTYVDTLISANGCDSIRTINLIVKSISSISINQTICNGQNYLGYTLTGKYVDTLIAANGCDSIRTINLTVIPPLKSSINQIICNGQSYLGHTLTGIYVDTLIAVNGCDSIRTINLTVSPASADTIDYTICSGQTYLGHSSGGTYVDTLVAANGCDSVRTINLTVLQPIFDTTDQTICKGEAYLNHTVTGTYMDTLLSINGCDSILTLHLTVKSGSFSTIKQTICNGDSYLGHNTTGSFTDTLIAQNGCDSLRTLNLLVTQNSSSILNPVICNGEVFEGYNIAGLYVDTLIATNGCDSIRTINLTVQNKPNPNLGSDTIICNEDRLLLFPGNFDTYLWQDGSVQSSFMVNGSGVFSVTVSNSCGSSSDEITVIQKACEIYFPNTFTPNKDGKNEVFNILNAHDLKGYYLAIYDRWGERVFETHDYKKGWDGNKNNKPAEVGTYVWYCVFLKDTYAKNMKGTVTLLR